MRGSRAGSQDYGRGQKGAVYTALSDLSSTRAADTMTDIYDDVLKSIINRRVYALLNGDMKDKISIFIWIDKEGGSRVKLSDLENFE